MKRKYPCLLLLAVWGASCSARGEPDAVLVESFAEGDYDHSNWRIDPKKLPAATFQVDAEGLAIGIPAEATGGNPAELKSQFKVGGDFEIALEYSIDSLPKPETGYMNLEISLYSAGGSASFMRTQQAKSGAGFAIWSQPSAPGGKTSWRFVPLDTQPEGRSELLVRRRGGAVTFLARQDPASGLVEVGQLDYPDGPDSVQFRVTGKRVNQPVAVKFHQIRVAADHLWHPQAGATTTSSDPLRRISVATAALLAMGAAVLLWVWRRRAT